MSNPDESINPRILEAAKKEFLTHGYEKASTNVICKNAGVTSGALYKRYAGKDELFCAIVAPVAEQFKAIMQARNDNFHSSSKEIQEETALDSGTDAASFIDYIYENLDVFKLLMRCAQGSSYGNYMEELAEISTVSTIRFMKETGHEAKVNGQEVAEETIRILVSSYMYGLFKPVVQDMNREDAILYTEHLKHFFDVGWADLFGLT